MYTSFNDNKMSPFSTYLTNATGSYPKDWNPNPLQEQSIQTATKWLWFLMPPVVIAMGTFGNVASLAVLRRVGVVGGTSPINLYLFALALSDLVVLYTGLLQYWIMELASYDIYSWHSAMCKVGMWLSSSSVIISTYLLVALTIQRALSVIFPHRIHLMCTRRTTLGLIGGTAAASLLCMVHVLYGYDVVYPVNSTQGTCGFGSPEYFAFIDVLLYFQVVQVALFPFVCLVISNSILAWRLAGSVSAAGLNVAATGADHSEKMKERRRKASSTTLTVMVMSLTFIIFTLPFFMNLLFHSVDNLDAQDLLDVETAAVDHLVQSFLTIWLYGNSAVNFYLYCLTGTKFRQEFLNLFRRTSKIQGAAASVQSSVTEDTYDEF